jgi:hypothetical protein
MVPESIRPLLSLHLSEQIGEQDQRPILLKY